MGMFVASLNNQNFPSLKCVQRKAPSTRKRFFIVFIKTANFSLRFHLASTRKCLKTITFEKGLQREKYENNMKKMCICNTIVAFSLKTMSFSMKICSCRRGLSWTSLGSLLKCTFCYFSQSSALFKSQLLTLVNFKVGFNMVN